MKFRSKLSLFFSITIVVVASLVTSLVYFYLKETLTEHIKGEIQFQAVAIIDDLDDFVFERQADISFLATDSVLRRQPFDAYRITERLIFHRDIYQYYSSLSFFDLERVRIADTNGSKVGERHPNTEYWPAIEAGRDKVVISLSRSETEHTNVLHFATTVHNVQNEPVGVLVSRVLLSDLLTNIRESLRPLTNDHPYLNDHPHSAKRFAAYRYDIVDGQGNLIYSSSDHIAAKDKISAEWGSIKKHLQNGQASGVLQLPIPQGIVGEGKIAAFAHSRAVHDFPSLGWTAIIHVPTKIALADVSELRDTTLLTFALVTLLALGVIPFFSRTVTRPVSELSRTVSAIGKGSLGERSSISSSDEFGELARVINFMAGELQGNKKKLLKFNEELSARVVERTWAMEQANERLKTELSKRQSAQESLQERVKLADFSAAIGVCVSSRDGLDATLQSCAETIVLHLDAAFARIWLINDKKNVLELRASAGMYTHLDGEHSRIPVGKYKIGRIAAERQPHLTNQVAGDPRVHDQDWARSEKMVAFAGYPLIVGDDLVGVLGLFSRREISPETFEALSSASDFIALGMRRILSENDLAASQEFLDKIINSVADPVFVKDEEYRLVLVNNAFCELIGYSCEELLNKSDYDFFPAEEAEVFQAKDDEVLWSGRVNINEEKITDASGRTHTIITKKTLHVDSRGNRFIVGIARDVSEQKRAEMIIRQSEEKFRRLAENLTEVIYRADPNTYEATFVNQAIEDLYGYSQEEWLADPKLWEKAIHPDDVDRVFTILEQADRTKEPFSYEYRIVRRDGTIRWVEDRVNWEKSPDGTTVSISGVVYDITDRKRIEEKLREISLRDELTGLYNRRGFTTLAEQQLKVADRKKQAASLSFIDLDDMKGINDRFGHQAGDQALIDTANILLRTFRESDIIGRIGGDEFAIMSGEAGAEDSTVLQKRLRDHLEEHEQQSDAAYTLELSIGTVDYEPGSSMSLEQLMNKADKLMYEQKIKKKS